MSWTIRGGKAAATGRPWVKYRWNRSGKKCWRPLPLIQPSSSRIRVLHLITRLPVGGAEKVLVDIVRRLDPAQYQSVVCCIQAKGDLAIEIEKLGVPLVCLHRMQSRRFDWGAVRDLTRL